MCCSLLTLDARSFPAESTMSPLLSSFVSTPVSWFLSSWRHVSRHEEQSLPKQHGEPAHHPCIVRSISIQSCMTTVALLQASALALAMLKLKTRVTHDLMREMMLGAFAAESILRDQMLCL